MRCTAFIGDVNGDIRSLELMVDYLITRVERIVLLGDLLGSCRSSRLVLDYVVGLKSVLPELVVIQGNHEASLCTFLDSGDFVQYIKASGVGVLQSYLGVAFGEVAETFRANFPSVHLKLLQDMPLYLEEPEFFASHSGLDPMDPRCREARVIRDGKYPLCLDTATVFDRPVIFGHFIQKSEKPMVLQKRYLLDTGCGTRGGPLTALTLPERIFFQTRLNRVDMLD